jgi:hypothetical protein
MDSIHGPVFSILLVLLFSLITFLRMVFPQASRKAEAITLAITTVVFFGLCTVFLRH